MKSKLDHERIAGCCAGTMFIEFAFAGIHNELTKNGGDVSSLNLTSKGRRVSNEVVFREMLMSIVSVPFDTGEMTRQELGSVNEITMYLSTPIEEEIEE